MNAYIINELKWNHKLSFSLRANTDGETGISWFPVRKLAMYVQ